MTTHVHGKHSSSDPPKTVTIVVVVVVLVVFATARVKVVGKFHIGASHLTNDARVSCVCVYGVAQVCECS